MSTNKEETRNNVDDEEQKEMDGLLVIANEKDVLQSACVLCVCVSLYIYISVVFLPQNNVSILLKWSFAWLLMLLGIKLYRSNGMDLFTFWAQRHHVKI